MTNQIGDGTMKTMNEQQNAGRRKQKRKKADADNGIIYQFEIPSRMTYSLVIGWQLIKLEFPFRKGKHERIKSVDLM